LDLVFIPQIAALSGGAAIAGLALLRRGLVGYRTADRIAGTGTSTVSSLAVGEVRISGTVEPAEVVLISALQSVRCVYYRSTIDEDDDSDSGPAFLEERSIGFRVRDVSASIRVFPRGGRFDAPMRFEAGTDLSGDEPADLELRLGSAMAVGEPDREALIAELLRTPSMEDLAGDGRDPLRRERHGRRQYRETRLEPGDPITVIGRALPFGDLPDPAGADLGAGPDGPIADPEVAADLAAARAAGTLLDDPEEAWGNAAIPGFGIGRPVIAPTLDPAANPLPLAAPEEAERFERTFEIEPETLVLAASADVPLLIAFGTPGAIVDRNRETYLLGLLGASLAIVSAMIFAIMLSGGFGA
jgi:hypothetical protein